MKIHITRWCFLNADANVLIIDSTGYKVSAKLRDSIQKDDCAWKLSYSIEEYLSGSNKNLEEYDYIYVLSDGTIRNSKGLFEWSRFVRNEVESDNDDEAEIVVKQIRALSGKECICFKKKGKKFQWKKEVLL